MSLKTLSYLLFKIKTYFSILPHIISQIHGHQATVQIPSLVQWWTKQMVFVFSLVVWVVSGCWTVGGVGSICKTKGTFHILLYKFSKHLQRSKLLCGGFTCSVRSSLRCQCGKYNLCRDVWGQLYRVV